jgi:hypothetical protein
MSRSDSLHAMPRGGVFVAGRPQMARGLQFDGTRFMTSASNLSDGVEIGVAWCWATGSKTKGDGDSIASVVVVHLEAIRQPEGLQKLR